MDDCVFCSQSLGNGEQTTKLGAKGCDGISKANDLRQADISVAPGQVVHTKCRRNSAPNCLLSETTENGTVLVVPATLCVRVDLPVLRFTTANTVCSVEHQTSTRADKKHINLYQSKQWTSRRRLQKDVLNAMMHGQRQ